MSFDEAIRHGDLSSHEVKQDCIESLAGRRRNGLNEPRSVQGMTDHSRRAIINRSNDASRHSVSTPHRIDGSTRSGESRNNIAECGGPAVLDAALDHISDGYLLQLFNRTATLELWYENRHASFERYIAFLVDAKEVGCRL
jgi:hypothetical protein